MRIFLIGLVLLVFFGCERKADVEASDIPPLSTVKNEKNKCGSICFFRTNKEVYRPGETVYITTVVKRIDNNNIRSCTQKDSLFLKVYNGNSNTLFDTLRGDISQPVLVDSFRIPLNAKPDKYTILGSLSSNLINRLHTSSFYVLPSKPAKVSFDIEMKCTELEYDSITISITGKQKTGEPLSNEFVTLQVYSENRLAHSHNNSRGYYTVPRRSIDKQALRPKKVQLDADGSATELLHLPRARFFQSLVAEVTYTDNLQRQAGSTSTPLFRFNKSVPTVIQTEFSNSYVGEDIRFFFMAQKHGMPLLNTSISIRMYDAKQQLIDTTITSNQKGVALLSHTFSSADKYTIQASSVQGKSSLEFYIDDKSKSPQASLSHLSYFTEGEQKASLKTDMTKEVHQTKIQITDRKSTPKWFSAKIEIADDKDTPLKCNFSLSLFHSKNQHLVNHIKRSLLFNRNKEQEMIYQNLWYHGEKPTYAFTDIEWSSTISARNLGLYYRPDTFNSKDKELRFIKRFSPWESEEIEMRKPQATTTQSHPRREPRQHLWRRTYHVPPSYLRMMYGRYDENSYVEKLNLSPLAYSLTEEENYSYFIPNITTNENGEAEISIPFPDIEGEWILRAIGSDGEGHLIDFTDTIMTKIGM